MTNPASIISPIVKHLLILIILYLPCSATGQSVSYSAWKEMAKIDIGLLPKYGNRIKTKQQQKADRQMVKTALANGETLQNASDNFVKSGFDYLYRKDLKTAMRRFNQAWLIDSTNANAFWGFGAVYLTFGDPLVALAQYDEGLQFNPKSTNILTDKATIFMMRYSSSRDEKDYQTALQFFQESYAIDANNQNTLFKLSACYFTKRNCENAWKYYNECQALGGKPITQAYTEALNESCKR